MRGRRFPAAVVAALSLAGTVCRQKPAAAPAGPAVATFDGGAVTAADVDRAVLDLPPGQRRPADGDLLTWYERIARDVAMQSVLLKEARAEKLDAGPEFERARDEARRQAAVSLFLEKKLPPAPAPTAAEIEAYYRDHLKDFKSPPARQTYHIFRRVAAGADAAPALAEMRRLRERVVAGEGFAKLAAEASDSESRHQKGLLGWVTPGKFGPELEKVVFSLQLNVPSQPLRTATGVHMFLVEQETPAKTLTLPEVRAAIGALLSAQRQQAALQELIGTAPIEGSFVPGVEELRALLTAGDPGALALRIGDFKLTVGQVYARMLAGQQSPVAPGDTPAHSLLLALERRERAYRHAVRDGVDRDPEAEAMVQRILDRELASLQMRKRLQARVDRDPQRLQAYYDANRARFSTPLRLQVQRLSARLSPDANQLMARLERARPELDAGRLQFDRLASELGATLSGPDWELPTQIAQRERRPMGEVVGLKPGQHGAPYRIEDRIEMIRVAARAEPELQPLEQIRDRVRMDLLTTHREDEYGAVVQEVLAERHFAIVRAELEAMIRRPAAASR